MSDFLGGLPKPPALEGLGGGMMGPAKQAVPATEDAEQRQRTLMAQALMNSGPKRAAPVAAMGAGGWMSGLAGILGGITSGLQQQGMQATPSPSLGGKPMSPDGSSFSFGKSLDTGMGMFPQNGGMKG